MYLNLPIFRGACALSMFHTQNILHEGNINYININSFMPSTNSLKFRKLVSAKNKNNNWNPLKSQT